VIVTPPMELSVRASAQLAGLAMTMVSAVIVQMTTVSMNGSSRATRPSLAGCLVFTAEWAIGAEPRPASLENAARLKPMISAPSTPPATPSGLNAPSMIVLIAAVRRRSG
jgi:hypothetical protein